MSKSFIVTGSLFGDEGKGSVSDYLASIHDIHENVRFNGGSQASHTVVVNNKKHKFSQLGSTMLNDSKTYLSDNTIVNPFNIVTEAKRLSEITNMSVEEIIDRVYLSKQASLVTPYHSLINKLRELYQKDNNFGSVGTGVSEVNRLKNSTGIDIKIDDFINGNYEHKLHELFDYTKDYLKMVRPSINEDLFEELISEKDLYYLTHDRNRDYIIRCYRNLFDSNLFHLVDGIDEFHTGGNVLFEGSQGLLIDKDYGIKPNTTMLDTTNKYGVKLSQDINSNPVRVGCLSSLNSRHGKGLLTTHDDYLDSIIHDENQMPSYFQGVPRYGWIDCVLIRYSNMVNPNDYYIMSHLDRLSNLDVLKICNSYEYDGLITDEFNELFEYYIENGKVIIINIKKNSDNLKDYLSKCKPRYIELENKKRNISDYKDYYDLPFIYQDYVSLIELLTNIKIKTVSVGPDRNQKLERILI